MTDNATVQTSAPDNGAQQLGPITSAEPATSPRRRGPSKAEPKIKEWTEQWEKAEAASTSSKITERSAFTFRDPQIGLPLLARLRMIALLSEQGLETFFASRKAEQAASGASEPATAQEASKQAGAAKAAESKASIEDKLEWGLQWWKQNRHRDIDPKMFATSVFDGPRAVWDFRDWLESGRLQLGQRTELLPPRDFHPTDDRETVLNNAVNFINSNSLQPILTVEGDGMGEGLRAFANALRDELATRDLHKRPVLYLPISRTAPLTQDEVDGDEESAPDREEKVSYARMVAQLLAFFRRERLDPDAAPLSASEIRAALDFIRSELARTPCVLVLDGWAAFSGPLPALGSLLIDDGLNALLGELVHPYRAPGETEIDPAIFYRNRFVVLASTNRQIGGPFVGMALQLLGPNSTDMPEIVRSQGRHRLANIAESMSTERTEVVLALAQFLVNQVPGDEPIAKGDQRFVGDADALRAAAEKVIRNAPLANLVLTIATLMPDGVRLRTLERLLAAWREAWPGQPLGKAWDIGPRRAGEIGEAITMLAPILTVGVDDFVRGLDGRALELRDPLPEPTESGPPSPPQLHADTLDPDTSPPVTKEEDFILTAEADAAALADPPASPAEEPDLSQGRDYIDFAAPRLRELFAKHLLGRSKFDPVAVARAHRLMADIALANYNQVVLLGDWRDASDARFYRRLFQALYHGYCSLALGPAAVDRGLKGIGERALPSNASHAYRRLYSVFYRALLETPPEWNLSRTLGRDDVKVDLLLLMMSLGDQKNWDWLTINNSRKPKISPFLQSGPSEGWTAARSIAIDQLTSLAKAALRNNELSLAGDAVSMGLDHLGPEAPVETEDFDDEGGGAQDEEELQDDEEFDFEALRFEQETVTASDGKSDTPPAGEFDPGPEHRALLHRLAPRELRAWTPEHRARLGLDKIGVDVWVVSSKADQLENVLVRIRNLMTSAYDFREPWFGLIERMRDTLMGPGPLQKRVERRLSTLEGLLAKVDVETLSAWSDLIGLLAETNVIETEQGQRSNDPRLLDQRLSRLLLAYLMLASADRMRRLAFDREPLRRDFHINPHTSRVLIRVLLQLVKYCRRRAEDKADADPTKAQDNAAAAFFYAQAERQFAILSRYVAQYATERPSLLILKAALVRHRPADRLEDLLEAETLLAKADRLMTAATHRPRVRLRLMRERAKVYRALASHPHARGRQTYADLAFLEIDRLYRLADDASLILWKGIANGQWTKMEEALVKALPTGCLTRRMTGLYKDMGSKPDVEETKTKARAKGGAAAV